MRGWSGPYQPHPINPAWNCNYSHSSVRQLDAAWLVFSHSSNSPADCRRSPQGIPPHEGRESTCHHDMPQGLILHLSEGALYFHNRNAPCTDSPYPRKWQDSATTEGMSCFQSAACKSNLDRAISIRRPDNAEQASLFFLEPRCTRPMSAILMQHLPWTSACNRISGLRDESQPQCREPRRHLHPTQDVPWRPQWLVSAEKSVRMGTIFAEIHSSEMPTPVRCRFSIVVADRPPMVRECE
mmetsp:Transcript_19944/g.32989  ORF Transcript_19944/g.32989 Transcript_19944/m.32989 type:complete len:240 (+) Transcript_19944:263-982(+)